MDFSCGRSGGDPSCWFSVSPSVVGDAPASACEIWAAAAVLSCEEVAGAGAEGSADADADAEEEGLLKQRMESRTCAK